jgi:hypothetical protein
MHIYRAAQGAMREIYVGLTNICSMEETKVRQRLRDINKIKEIEILDIFKVWSIREGGRQQSTIWMVPMGKLVNRRNSGSGYCNTLCYRNPN